MFEWWHHTKTDSDSDLRSKPGCPIQNGRDRKTVDWGGGYFTLTMVVVRQIKLEKERIKGKSFYF